MDALCVTSIRTASIILQSPQNKYNSIDFSLSLREGYKGQSWAKMKESSSVPVELWKGWEWGEAELTEDARTQGSLEAANICLPKTLATEIPKDCAFSFSVFVQLWQQWFPVVIFFIIWRNA